MALFLIVFIVFYAIAFNMRDKMSKRMICIYLAYWAISSFWCLQGVYDLQVSDNTLYLVYIHLLSFVIGFSIGGRPHRNYSSLDIDSDTIKKQIESILNNPAVRVFLIILTLYFISLYAAFFVRIQVLASASDARAEFYAGELYGPIFYYLNPYLFIPLNNILLPIMAYRATYRRDFMFWVLLINIFVYSSLSGGRLEYLKIAICFLCLIYCIFDLIKNKWKLFFVGVFLAAALFVLLSITSALRSGYLDINRSSLEAGIEVAEEHLQTYSAGPIAAFDYSLQNNYLSRVGGFHYGKLTINSLLRFFAAPLRFLGYSTEDPLARVADLKQNDSISLSDEVHFNALYTALFIYYLDFGVLGIIVIPFIFGFIFRRLLILFLKKQNLALLILITWMFYSTLRSVTDYPFYSPMDIPLIFILWYLGTRKQKKAI